MLLSIANGGEVDAVLVQELPVGVLIRARGDPQHYELRHLPLQLVQRRNLLDTRWAPRRPKVEHHDFTAVTAQLHPAGAINNREIRGWLSDLPRMVPPVAPRRQHKRE